MPSTPPSAKHKPAPKEVSMFDLEVPEPAPKAVPPSPDGAPAPKLPSYRLHRPSGKAVVTIAGTDHYLGVHGSEQSRAHYDRLVADWLARGRPKFEAKAGADLTVALVVLSYWKHVKATYSRQTSLGTIAPALRRLRRLFGATPVNEFGPHKLKAFAEALVVERDKNGKRLARRYVNRSIGEVKRCIKWAVGEELVPPSVLHGLQAVESLRMGRTSAPETNPVQPVADAIVEKTLEHLPPVVADMVRVQRLTGMRPGELCKLRMSELDMSEEVWFHRPLHHKTAHHGKTRSIPIGPKAAAILRKYLLPDVTAYLFSPAEAVRQRMVEAHAARKTKFSPSQRARARRIARNPKRQFREYYTTQGYEIAIRRACVAGKLPHWAPNQLRHTRATELRKQFGLDAASAVLGHAKVETTQIYAEKNLELAARMALATG